MDDARAPMTKVWAAEPPEPIMAGAITREPFPMHCLPDVLQDGVYGIQAVVQCPPALVAQSVIAAVAFVAQAHINVTLIQGQVSPTSCFLVTVASSGERKTSADKLAIAPIREFEAELLRAYRSLMNAHENDAAIYDRKRKQIIEEKDKGDNTSRHNIEAELEALGDRPEPPPLPILLCAEPTYEGAVKLSRFGLGYLGIFSSEGGQFIHGHGMNRDNRPKTGPALSSAWDGEPITRVRGGDDLVALYNRRWSMSLMIQPGIAIGLFGDDALRDQGFMSRVLPAWPESMMGTRLFVAAQPESRQRIQRYHLHLRALLNLPVPLVEDTKNELDPRTLTLDRGANEILIAFHNWVEPQTGRDGLLDPISGLAAKAAEHAARLAAIFTFVKDPGTAVVSEEIMAGAIQLVRWYLTEALRIVEAVREPEEVSHAELVRQWLVSSWSEDFIAMPLLQRFGPNALRKHRPELQRAIAVLVERGHLIAVDHSPMIAGKARKTAWRIVREVEA